MSVDLVNLSYKQKNLSSSEHSVLNVLAFRANQNNECWPSVKSLCENTSLNRKTVYQSLISLIEKGLIIKTGEMKGRTKSVPVYKLSLPKNGCTQKLSVPVLDESLPKNGSSKLTQNWDIERSILKEKGKDFFLLLKPKNQEQAQTIYHLLKTGFDPNTDELKTLKPLIDDYLKNQSNITI